MPHFSLGTLHFMALTLDGIGSRIWIRWIRCNLRHSLPPLLLFLLKCGKIYDIIIIRNKRAGGTIIMKQEVRLNKNEANIVIKVLNELLHRPWEELNAYFDSWTIHEIQVLYWRFKNECGKLK